MKQRSEWWYFTGNLEDERGGEYGYQVTFFRVGLELLKEQIHKDIARGHEFFQR